MARSKSSALQAADCAVASSLEMSTTVASSISRTTGARHLTKARRRSSKPMTLAHHTPSPAQVYIATVCYHGTTVNAP
jgi:hypothetical protein